MSADLKLWLSISNLRDVPPQMLLFAMVREFMNDTFEVDENDTQEDILRRVSKPIKYSNLVILIFIFSPNLIPSN